MVSRAALAGRLAWRTRTTLEIDGRPFAPRVAGTDGDMHYAENSEPHDNDHALAPEQYNVISDVVNLTGVDGPYVLQSDYDPKEGIYDPGETENSLAAKGWIYLGWLETDGSAGDLVDLDEWVNAVDGNSPAGGSAKTNVLSSWSDFETSEGGGPLDLTAYLGSWGVDTTNNTVWAVIDHNSGFGVVPEPAALSLLALGGLAALRRRRR